MLKLPHRWCSRWKVIKWLQHIWVPWHIVLALPQQKDTFSFDNSINFVARVSIHCHPICYYLYTSVRVNPFSAFRHNVALILSLHAHRAQTLAQHIVHTCSARDHREAFWLVSISLTVSNILMNMRPTSLPQNADKNSSPFTRLTL